MIRSLRRRSGYPAESRKELDVVFELDDFGCNHVISDMCQSHDCREELLALKAINPAFKVTLFTIPYELTSELAEWCVENSDWVELAAHGFYHSSNYECEKMSYDEFAGEMERIAPILEGFRKIFRAPGWQISDDALRWLADNDWVVADQGYNDERRPHYGKAYVNYDGNFKLKGRGKDEDVEAFHGHTWPVGWNGIQEVFTEVSQLVAETKEFKFLSEVVNA
jgi:hypothetical protein